MAEEHVLAAIELEHHAMLRYIDEILGQREEILAAFIAKYGCQPDEVMQVEETNLGTGKKIWYVIRKPGYSSPHVGANPAEDGRAVRP